MTSNVSNPAAAASALADAYLKLGGQEQYPKQMEQLLTEMLGNRQSGLAAADLPKFIADDPKAIAQEMADAYQKMAGKQLYPGQIEQLLIDLFAYRESLVRAAFNDAGRQNLVAFARAPMLDYLGELVGVTRQPAQPAMAKVKFTFPAYAGGARQVQVRMGTRVSGNSDIQFQTTAQLTVDLGDQPQPADCDVVATVPGEIGNLLQASDLNQLLDDVGVKVGVVCVKAPWGGAEAEDDEHLRQRIRQAPESFSVAGSAAAYRFHALSASPDIVDVAVVSQSSLPDDDPLKAEIKAGEVRLFPLFVGNGAGQAAPVPGDPRPPEEADPQLRKVWLACSADKVRPLTDKVTVRRPPTEHFDVEALLQTYAGMDGELVKQKARAALQAYLDERQNQLGRDIVPSQLVAALSVPGVYQVKLLQPAQAKTVASYAWSSCASVSVDLDKDNGGSHD
ncbi:baseplate J/gp47 family protein [Chromobacterium sp. IIBBL 290-4]|uniref:baseplate assembly protein n=1 Tax=Chromobacterium sp. IIBBL 290-4 TaxID=2953890 RepID=UPI0020B66D51|nr:baseplate J/gp47 family protein [Chromobacterium sp. IIBBL 290-4]UTH76105.1 baseplate J/gp47 family protein [Chromobacterium sp. IIBBL 290-4]